MSHPAPASTGSPTSSSRRLPSRLDSTDADGRGRDVETMSEGARSRSSSGSSLEGLTARLRGARQGKKSTAPRRPPTTEDSQDGVRGAEMQGSDAQSASDAAGATEPRRSSVPTISLSIDQVESAHGKTKLVTPDPTEPLPQLSVPTPFDSPALSTDSSSFDVQAMPPPRIQINENDAGEDKGPAATTFASSPARSEMSDADDASRSDGESDDDPSDSESLNVVSRSDSHPDPRELLRSQLAKASSERRDDDTAEERESERERRLGLNRMASDTSQSSRLGKVRDSGPEKQKMVYRKRRYFVLSSAGKLVYTS